MKNKSMASVLGVFCIFVITATITHVTAKTDDKGAARGASHQFKVGDSGGWHEPDANSTEVYEEWATKNRFKIGDSLYFEYRNDSVLEVEKQGYYHCNMTKPIASYKDGKTIIKLDKPGPFYFISGVPDHCKSGQRLLVNVINPFATPPSPSTHPSPPSHPSIAVPPQPYVTDSPAPSPEANSGLTVKVTSFPILVALVIILGLMHQISV